MSASVENVESCARGFMVEMGFVIAGVETVEGAQKLEEVKVGGEELEKAGVETLRGVEVEEEVKAIRTSDRDDDGVEDGFEF